MPHPAKLDPLYETAKQLILDNCEPTIPLLQRHLKIGYTRARSLMAAMEGNIVTVLDEAGSRKMLYAEAAHSGIGSSRMSENVWPLTGDEAAAVYKRITALCFSQRGIGKALNEDAMLISGVVQMECIREHSTFDLSNSCCFAIADGVSTHLQAAVASSRLLGRLIHLLLDANENVSIVELLHRLQVKFAALADNPNYFGMASTLVGARLVGNEATIFNVGDSRAYLLTNSSNGCHAKLLSRDHNVLNDLLDGGDMTPEQAKKAASIYRGLTSQFTADPTYDRLKVNVFTHTLQQGERLLLCSDGLNEVVNDAEIAVLFAENSDEALSKAYMASRRVGGRDEFSVIVIEVINFDATLKPI
jgi:protein phosphatase